MNWTLVGWILIGLSALLLVLFTFIFHSKSHYIVRYIPEAVAMRDSQASSVERGDSRQVILGDQLWSRLYPGLGLHALAVLPVILAPETVADGRLSISASGCSLVVFARQIVQSCYQDGFSPLLVQPFVQTTLPGPTPLSLVAGLLPEMTQKNFGSLALFGNYGPESVLLTEAVQSHDGFVYASAGALAAQAALYASVRNLVIGETVFMMPGLFTPDAANQASWMMEDILRIVLMLGLIVGAVLKAMGVL